jgi:phytol kinase
MSALLDLLDPWIPDAGTAAVVVPLGAAYTALAARAVGWLRVERGMEAPYTRKAFHFAILTAAGVAQLAWGRPGTVAFGSVVALAVLHAAWRGRGFPFYEAMARPSDAPRRRLFVLVPLAATAAGGVAANLLFPAHAMVGYLVCGWGDAVGEPVGVRWGRRAYRVPSLAGVPARRTLEGSAAVALAGAGAAAAALWMAGTPLPASLGVGAVVGLVAAGVEAVSHHGTDNFTLQVASAGVAALLA